MEGDTTFRGIQCLLFGDHFAEDYMKMKEFGWKGMSLDPDEQFVLIKLVGMIDCHYSIKYYSLINEITLI